MTLKEQIDISLDSPFKKLLIEESAKNFAIEFAEWCIENRVEFKDSTEDGIIYSWNKSGNDYTMYQLLQNFKIEKNL